MILRRIIAVALAVGAIVFVNACVESLATDTRHANLLYVAAGFGLLLGLAFAASHRMWHREGV